MSYTSRPLLASAAFVMLAGQAIAADLPSKYSTPATPYNAPQYDWSGFYAGAAADYVPGFKGTGDLSKSAASMLNPKGQGYQGTLYAGYNYKFGSFVVGPEADLSIGKVSDSRSYTDLAGTYKVKLNQEASGSLRARFGYAFNNILVFATSGLAIIQTKLSASIAMPAYSDHASGERTLYGYALGGGLEYGINKNLIARTEYRYTQAEKSTNGSKFGLNEQEVRAGLAYKF